MNEGWQLKKLDDLCSIKGRIGYRGYTKKDIVKEGEGAITLSPSNIKENKFDLSECTFISWFKYEESPEIKVYNGDILFVKTGSTYGKVALVENLNEKATINPQFVVLKDIECSNKFLYYALITTQFKKALENIVGGTATPTLSQTNLGNLRIPVPPMEEQLQIVEVLEETFLQLSQAKSNIQRNIDNAKELFQAKLNQLFSQKGNGWSQEPLDSISEIINGYSFKSGDFSPDNEVKSIKITNVGVKAFVEDDQNNLPIEFLSKHKKVLVKAGELVVALTRTIISDGLKVARVPNSYDESLLNQRVAAIRANQKRVESDYLYHFFSTDIVYDYVLSNVNTLMQPNLSIKDLKRMPVPICELEEQRTISEKIETIARNIDHIVHSELKKLDQITKLKKSILDKAFSGELINKTTSI